MSTLHYGDDRLAIRIDDVRRTDRVTAKRIVNEAARWGMARRRATEVVADLLDRTPAAVAAARADTEGVPEALVDLVGLQLARVRSEFASPTA